MTVGALGPFWKRLPPPTPPWRWAELQHRDLISLQGMKMFFMVVAAVYILYLLFLIVRACSELRHMPYVGQCHFTNAQCSWAWDGFWIFHVSWSGVGRDLGAGQVTCAHSH